MDTSNDLYQSLRYKIPGNRSCCVVNCANSGKKLSNWLKGDCEIHICKRDFFKCSCIPPYLLFTFPTQLKDPDMRYKWIKAINRLDANDQNKIWQPTPNSRVCSHHFPNRLPTENEPIPSINLGYDVNSSNSIFSPGRKAPKKRLLNLESTQDKRRRISNVDLKNEVSNTHIIIYLYLFLG